MAIADLYARSDAVAADGTQSGAGLGDRIAEYLAGTGRALTAREIARGIHARHADVLHVLRHDARFCGPLYPEGRRRTSKPYGLCPCAQERIQKRSQATEAT